MKEKKDNKEKVCVTCVWVVEGGWLVVFWGGRGFFEVLLSAV